MIDSPVMIDISKTFPQVVTMEGDNIGMALTLVLSWSALTADHITTTCELVMNTPMVKSRPCNV